MATAVGGCVVVLRFSRNGYGRYKSHRVDRHKHLDNTTISEVFSGRNIIHFQLQSEERTNVMLCIVDCVEKRAK